MKNQAITLDNLNQMTDEEVAELNKKIAKTVTIQLAANISAIVIGTVVAKKIADRIQESTAK